MKGAGSIQETLQQYILGTAGLGGVWRNVTLEESVKTILYALETGFTAIDTAPAYGDGEWAVGRALQQWKGQRPQISTKVGRLKSFAADKGAYDYTAAGMTKSLQASLKTLGLDGVDVLFLHEPVAIPDHQVEQAVEKMACFKKDGYAGSIGLGGDYPPSFQQYIDAGIFDVVMEFNRLDACCIDALNTTLPECRQREIQYWAASPLHMGLLGNRFDAFVKDRPSWLPQNYIDKAIGVDKIAAANSLTLSSLALRFLQSIPLPVKIVIGPVDSNEFKDCLQAIVSGPLETAVYNNIINHLQETE